jgi:hypothetical protein
VCCEDVCNGAWREVLFAAKIAVFREKQNFESHFLLFYAKIDQDIEKNRIFAPKLNTHPL